ncbi:MAG: TlpA disulfide reductase family protein [Gemmatimonadota bacterium]|nr:TlpA disulfide reductase family protein [Gemmatimonadota bacterium]MDQ8173839.1 TlpA disulfide reductase family protein [Gemmatimonadota bacterium]
MRLLTRVIASAVALSVSFAASVVQAQVGGIAVGATAPTLTLPSLSGAPVDLASMIGKKPMVIEFWATWCPLCKKLEPQLEKARTAYGDKVAFIGVGVSQNQSAERQLAYVKEKQMTGQFLFDQDGAAVKAFQVPHTSFVVVIDAAGKVVYTGVGAEQVIDDAVRKALPTR